MQSSSVPEVLPKSDILLHKIPPSPIQNTSVLNEISSPDLSEPTTSTLRRSPLDSNKSSSNVEARSSDNERVSASFISRAVFDSFRYKYSRTQSTLARSHPAHSRYRPAYTTYHYSNENRPSPEMHRKNSKSRSSFKNSLKIKPAVIANILTKSISLPDPSGSSSNSSKIPFFRSQSCPKPRIVPVNDDAIRRASSVSLSSNKKYSTLERPKNPPPPPPSTLKARTSKHFRSIISTSPLIIQRPLRDALRRFRNISYITKWRKRRRERRLSSAKGKTPLTKGSSKRPIQIVPTGRSSSGGRSRHHQVSRLVDLRQRARNSDGWRSARNAASTVRWELASGFAALLECGRRTGYILGGLGVRASDVAVRGWSNATTMTDNKIQDLKRSISSWSLSTFKKPRITAPKLKAPKLKFFGKKKNRLVKYIFLLK